MRNVRLLLISVAAAAITAATSPASAQKTLKVVQHSDIKVIDPIWSAAYIVRNHGYMIYDTLLAQDEKGDIKLQMLEKYETAAAAVVRSLSMNDMKLRVAI